jgi:hypothetical protein
MLKKYIVERDPPVHGDAPPDAAAAVIERARRLSRVGTGIVWVECFVAAGKEYSVFLATDESLVHAYARGRQGGAYRLTRVLTTVHPGERAA